MMAVFIEAAQAADMDERVNSYYASLGVLSWPPVVFDGIRYPGVSELAALQSAAFGVPADRHVEVGRHPDANDGPEFIALQEQVWETLKKDPRKEPEMTRHSGLALRDGCTDHN
ncbi:hypothetical protein O1M63_26055 [Streptomyces mirabilis]|nr:hypothetical protein [Streptomyces mirabilis]